MEAALRPRDAVARGGLCLSLTASTANAPLPEVPVVMRREAEAALWQRREGWPLRTLPDRRLPASAPWFEPRPRPVAALPSAAMMMPPAGGEIEVNTFTTGNQVRPSVATDSDGDFVVVWDSPNQDGNNDGVFAQRYLAAGTPQDPEFRTNSYTTNAQNVASVAMDADGDFSLANVVKALGRLEEAEAHYRETVRLKPGYAEAHYNLGLAYEKQGRIEQARAAYTRLLARTPPDATSTLCARSSPRAAPRSTATGRRYVTPRHDAS